MVSVLIIDDDEEIQRCLSDILEDQGYTVKCVKTGNEAINSSNEELFNVALIDIQLPDMQGTDLLTKFRKTEPEIIKIIITGHASLDNSIEATNKGVHGYIVKPLDPERLLEMIETHLNKQKQSVEFDDKKVAEFIETRYEWMSITKPQKRK